MVSAFRSLGLSARGSVKSLAISGAVRLAQTANTDKEDEAVIIDLREPCLATFAIKYLIAFTKATPLSIQVQISISNDLPIGKFFFAWKSFLGMVM